MLKPLFRSIIRSRSRKLEPWPVDPKEGSYSDWEYSQAKRDFRKFYIGRLTIEGKKVLDIGCGLGGRTVFYAGMKPAEIVGVDIDEENIRESIEYAKSKGCDDIAHFTAGDAANLPFEDGIFDIAFSENSFEHYSDPLAVLKEAGRVVRKSGLFVVNFSQWATPNGHHLGPWINLSWAHTVFSTEELAELTREAGEGMLEGMSDPEWREQLSSKLEISLKHFRNHLNHISISEFEKMLSEAGVWKVTYLRRTSSHWWAFPLKGLPGLREYFVGRNLYLLERI